MVFFKFNLFSFGYPHNNILEKNAQQVIEANILPTLVGLMTNVKTKNNLGVILSLFGVIGNLGNRY